MPRWGKIGLVVVAVALAIAAGVVATHWPYTQSAITKSLEQRFASTVQVKTFRVTYFAPGCVVEGVTLRRNSDPNSPPIATVERITIQGSYAGFFMFPRRVARVTADGLHVFASPQSAHAGPEAQAGSGADQMKVNVGEIHADGAIVESTSAAGNGPLRFEIHKLTLDSVSDDHPMSFHAELKNPEPPGELRMDGQFGPLNRENGGQTWASGSYVFQQADLGIFPGLGGTLSSSGKFNGKLEQLDVAGDTDVPDFNVTTGVHTVHLKTKFQALVDGWNGDVSLKSVTAQFGQTSLVASGEIAGKTGASGKPGVAGKNVSLAATQQRGTIQDWLELLAKRHYPSMTGAMSFRTQVQVPPGSHSFIERVNLQGDFEIGAAEFTKGETQQAVGNLSRIALGRKQDAAPDVCLRI